MASSFLPALGECEIRPAQGNQDFPPLQSTRQSDPHDQPGAAARLVQM